MTSETDIDLIHACRRGDMRAWERVLEKYERLVFSIALKYGLSVEDAADVTQTTFTILMQSLDSLREDTRLAPWLATVAKRHTWRCLTKRKREQVTPDEDLARQDWAVQRPANPFETWERVEWLRDGLGQLDERCRELLLTLYFEVETPSYVEVAERFEMSPGSVGPTRARCLERLKSLMVEAVLV
ncbi:MAG TPA: sigma-70 family RNA polymerase sigma factor [Anaerolineales bacterium]|nr:sigma-70 family RNA polymerase sigma factor [Anaerolineales bacterium]